MELEIYGSPGQSRLFLTNQKFGLIAPMSPIRIATESLVIDLEYRTDGAQLGQC
jgi:hypothetical protein